MEGADRIRAYASAVFEVARADESEVHSALAVAVGQQLIEEEPAAPGR